MVLVVTSLTTRESARRVRFEPTSNITATNVQKAIEQASMVFAVGTISEPPSAPTVTINTTDIEVGVDTRSTAVSVNLPSAVAWAAANKTGLELTIVDLFNNAAANNITPVLNGADAWASGAVVPVITADGGLLKLRPVLSPPGWYIRGIN